MGNKENNKTARNVNQLKLVKYEVSISTMMKKGKDC